MTARLVKLKSAPQSGYLYLISAVGTGRFKIGRTQFGVHKRLKDLQTCSPVKLRTVYHAYVANVNLYELELHQKFAQKREIGEWFALSPDEVTECILLMRLVQEQEPPETDFTDFVDFSVSNSAETVPLKGDETDETPEIRETTDPRWTVQRVRDLEQRFTLLNLTREQAQALIKQCVLN